MSLNFATQSSFTWDTLHSASEPNFYDQLLSPIQLSTPTNRIFWANKRSMSLGPDGKFQIPMIVKDYSPSMATKSYTFDMQDIDNVTTQEWTPIFMANGAGTNDVEWMRYKTNLARFNHVDIKVDSIHRGLTSALNFLLWWDWNSSDISGSNQIDINSQLSALTNPPEELYVKNITQVTQAPYSIPMLTRKVVNGYTLGNVPVTTTSNAYFRPVNTDGAAAAITRASSGDNVDCVTAIDATLCKALDMDDLRAHLDAISEGWQYNLYAACPPTLYAQIRNLILAQNTRDIGSPLADLGIRSSITWDEYNVVFYQEPIMKALWPNSIFFYDTDAIYLQYEMGFDPMIYPWERIPGTNMYGTAVYISFQMVRPDAQGVSAMHGYKAD